MASISSKFYHNDFKKCFPYPPSWHPPLPFPSSSPVTNTTSLPCHFTIVVCGTSPRLPLSPPSPHPSLSPQTRLTSLTSGCHCDFKGICISGANLSSLAEHAASHANDEKWAPSSGVLLRREEIPEGGRERRRKNVQGKKGEGKVKSAKIRVLKERFWYPKWAGKEDKRRRRKKEKPEGKGRRECKTYKNL